MNFAFHSPSSNRGFSLVELMVGIVISMLAILAVMQMFKFFEGNKRASTGGADAQTSGMLAINAIGKDMRQAGYGLSALAEAGALNCTIMAYNSNLGTTFTFTAAPLIINPANIPAGDSNTDIVMVTYGTSDGLAEGVSFTQPSGSSANYKVSNPNAFREGDIVLLVPTQPSTMDCSMAEITNLPGAYASCNSGSGQSDVIIHNSGNYKSAYQGCSQTVPSTWNMPSGLPGIDYSTSGGTIYDLGPLPKTVVYAIRNGNLTMCDYFATDCTSTANVSNTSIWVPIADNIVSLKAQYGRDTSSTSVCVVDTYDQTTPTDNAGWKGVLTARIALVARSVQPEKSTVTTSEPTWAGSTTTPSDPININLSAITNWQYYHYKVFETSIALRNSIWIGAQSGC